MSVNENYLILSIETSCDETSAAVTAERKVLSNTIWSQIDIHQPWGGVVPNLARKAHQERINQVIKKAIKQAETNCKRFKLKLPRKLNPRGKPEINLENIDAIAVTQGPGLAIALEVGIAKAKDLAKKINKPLIAVNHMEGHLLSPLALNIKSNGPFSNTKPEFPVLGLLVSGGHTQLVLMNDLGDYKLVGQTLDDAAGEAFDKVAKMLNLGYPGGPIVEELARDGNPKRFDLPIPMARHKSLNFSFAGLKTACLYKLRDIPEDKKNKQLLQDFAASFQYSLVKSITIKLKKAIQKYQPNQIFLGGGVINNLVLRREVRKAAKKFKLPVFIPYTDKLLADNAGMVGVAAWYSARQNKFVKNIATLDRQPNLKFQSNNKK